MHKYYIMLLNFRSTHIFEWEHMLVYNIQFLLKKMVLLSIKVPNELGYDNYFTGEDAGLGSQLILRTTDTIHHVKMTSTRCQQIFLTCE